MNKHTNIDIPIDLDLVEIMRETQRQHGTTGLIECIMQFCCDNMDFTFEDEMLAALTKFRLENS
jgi:hypothetical protein